jgi:hypothetical protein
VRFSKLVELLGRFGLSLRLLGDDAPITGSFWGEPEAGIVGRSVFVRLDTPVHSLLHETCHVQVVLADYLPGVGRDRLMRDMDAWGYSFRLGSSRAWFDSDAEDARAWLLERKLLIEAGTPAFVLRKS